MKNVGANTWLLNIAMSKETIKFFFFVSALLQDFFLCWDRWNGT